MIISSTAFEPFEKIFPESDWGHRCALTMLDDLTRFLTVVPIENQGSETVARAFVKKIRSNFGQLQSQQLIQQLGETFFEIELYIIKNGLLESLSLSKLDNNEIDPMVWKSITFHYTTVTDLDFGNCFPIKCRCLV